MTTAEGAALLAAGALCAVSLMLALVCVWMAGRMRREAEALKTARVETQTMLAQLRAASAQARTAAARLDQRARHAEPAAKLVYEALSTPVVKGLALASGVSQAARSLRSR
jgi:hypothetical protein